MTVLRQNRRVDPSSKEIFEFISLNTRFYLHPMKTNLIYRREDLVSLANVVNSSIFFSFKRPTLAINIGVYIY